MISGMDNIYEASEHRAMEFFSKLTEFDPEDFDQERLKAISEDIVTAYRANE